MNAGSPTPPRPQPASRQDTLVFFLRGHNKENIGDRHPALADDKRVRRIAPVLDSIPRLLINQAGRHVYAIGIVRPSFDNPKALILVSGNVQQVPEDVVVHLESLLNALHAARLRVREKDCVSFPPSFLEIPTYIPENTDDPLLKQILAMEVAVYRHSWIKVKRRSEKYGWSKAFLDVCAAVLSPSPPQLISREALTVLEELRGPEGDRDSILREFRTASGALVAILDVLRGECDDARIHWLRLALDALDISVDSLRQLLPGVLLNCRSYIRLVDEKYQYQGPDIARWMQKLLSTRQDFAQVMSFIGSPTLDDVLGAGFEIKVVTPAPVPPVLWEVSMDSLKSALGERYYNVAGMEESAMEKFVDRLANKIGHAVTKKDGIHCECAILVELDKISHTRPVIPYVGVSKLSCAFCHAYFTAYRQSKGSDIMTRGTHGQIVPWRSPTLAHDPQLDEMVRASMSSQLATSLGAAVMEGRGGSSQPLHVPHRKTNPVIRWSSPLFLRQW
ncbi:hypothetical protein L227DRAFT_564163 [Lentinus tigrinus ALCF2SS1-6]|uniref:Uncharacterized protein n=1 Tax=Lentinus tigrinus ALCF2SS1-6 TaxID=1328759 RepID=A0A5C2S6I5_9APHY|nr:hypothetical protein L227DRAFT_564163 [Lentinus tigrinus ALCF2SS1-6]